MDLTISDEKTKELLTEVIVDLLKNKKELFRDVLLEAAEEIGLANAIQEGRKGDFVSESEIFDLLGDSSEGSV
ncbi:MAG: hypothetical protein ACLFRG_18920 [Desulfococcaceae bacterium]